MNFHAFKKNGLHHMTAYFSLLAIIFSFHVPSSLWAEAAFFIDEEDQARTQRAYFLVGATLVALGAGVAYLASTNGSCCHKKHDSSYSDSSSSYDWDDSSDYSYRSDYSDYSSYRRSDYSRYSSEDYFSDYSIFNNNIVSSWSDSPSEILGPQFSLPRQKHKSAQGATTTANLLSGVLTSHISPGSQGSFTAFVHLPDGTTNTLGSLSFSENTSASLAYGPFNQTGTYTFGISLDVGSQLPLQTKVCSIEMEVNRSTTQRYDFNVPSHAPAHYEPPVCSYDLF